jgi:uncharacterized protein YqjF (DUF2071 family)
MRWQDLLFLHWRLPAESLRAKLPAGIELDLFAGEAWVGVVPFRMSNVRPRGLPGVPWLSAFPELNVRTYVTRDGKPGVWFFSLDAANPVAVRRARAKFHLPYFDARMTSRARGGAIEYASVRTHRGAPVGTFRASWRPAGPLFHARAGTLEHFFTARYCLYACDPAGRILRGEIDHPLWPLRAAQVDVAEDTMLAVHNLPTPADAPLAHCVERLDVVAWNVAPA